MSQRSVIIHNAYKTRNYYSPIYTILYIILLRLSCNWKLINTTINWLSNYHSLDLMLLHVHFEYYFSDHLQTVRVNSILSDSVPVRSGEPQGSVLGPFVYLYYTSNILSRVKFSRERELCTRVSSYLVLALFVSFVKLSERKIFIY